MTPTIVVPLDGSTLAERALPFATRLARAASAHMVLARVVTTAVEPVEATAREIQVYLDDAAARLREHGLSVETTTACGTPAAEILGIAHDRRASPAGYEHAWTIGHRPLALRQRRRRSPASGGLPGRAGSARRTH